MRLGTEAALKASLQGMGFSGRLNTAFIERVNLTVRDARLSSGTPHLGHREACPTAARSRGMVASVLSLRAPPCITSSGARAADSRVEASWWRNAIGNERQRWQPGEPIDDGRRMRCSLTPCRRFLLERYASQARLQCHGVEWWVKVPSEEVG